MILPNMAGDENLDFVYFGTTTDSSVFHQAVFVGGGLPGVASWWSSTIEIPNPDLYFQIFTTFVNDGFTASSSDYVALYIE